MRKWYHVSGQRDEGGDRGPRYVLFSGRGGSGTLLLVWWAVQEGGFHLHPWKVPLDLRHVRFGLGPSAFGARVWGAARGTAAPGGTLQWGPAHPAKPTPPKKQICFISIQQREGDPGPGQLQSSNQLRRPGKAGKTVQLLSIVLKANCSSE